MTNIFDIIIIGAGPAGIAAAVCASEYCDNILILDEQATPGGQIDRAVEAMKNRDREELGDSYHSGRKLVEKYPL